MQEDLLQLLALDLTLALGLILLSKLHGVSHELLHRSGL